MAVFSVWITVTIGISSGIFFPIVFKILLQKIPLAKIQNLQEITLFVVLIELILLFIQEISKTSSLSEKITPFLFPASTYELSVSLESAWPSVGQ